MPEIIVPESDHEFPMPDYANEVTPLKLDADGHVIVTDVEFPMPKVMTQHYNGPDTEPEVDEVVDEKTVDEKTVAAGAVDTKVVTTSDTK